MVLRYFMLLFYPKMHITLKLVVNSLFLGIQSLNTACVLLRPVCFVCKFCVPDNGIYVSVQS